MNVRLIGCVVVGLATWGCDEPPYNLGPTYAVSQLVSDQALLGSWAAADHSPGVMTLERVGYYRHLMTFSIDSSLLTFTAYFYRVGTTTFVDLTPTHEAPALMVPMHTWARVHMRDDTLWYGYLPESRWQEIARTHPQLFARAVDTPLLGRMPAESLEVLITEQMDDSMVDWHPSALVRVR